MSNAFQKFGLLDLNNVQGDLVLGLPKKAEIFFFFKIDESKLPKFRSGLSKVIPLITTTGNVQKELEKINAEKTRAKKAGVKPDILEIGCLNIAFSHKGILKLQITGGTGDEFFERGMNHPDERLALGDGEWAPEFQTEIHGAILATGHRLAKAESVLSEALILLGDSITKVTQVTGNVRPGDLEAHEHFGYADGIAQPIVKGFPGTIHPGKDVIDQGIIFVGRTDDHLPFANRASWAVDGSFLCFRKLKQLVPEFNDFLERHRLDTDDETKPDSTTGRLHAGAELLGARLVGRWKSGAPVEKSPLKDNPAFATDPRVNDDFRYEQGTVGQKKCPFAAHTRKTNPRDDLARFPIGPNRLEAHKIIRHGIQYGKEVTQQEHDDKKSSVDPDLERGLLFACYQSSIKEGFHFIQESWANDPTFPPFKPVDAGHDALIGVGPVGDRNNRHVNGHDPAHLPTTRRPPPAEEEKTQLKLDNIWVVPRGGEYFFSPSIFSLKKHFAREGETISAAPVQRQGEL